MVIIIIRSELKIYKLNTTLPMILNKIKLRFETTKCIVTPSSTLYEVKVSGSFNIFPLIYFILITFEY